MSNMLFKYLFKETSHGKLKSSYLSMYLLLLAPKEEKKNINVIKYKLSQKVRRYFHTVIVRWAFKDEPPFTVLWSRAGLVGSLKDFVPNHFVPLVSRNMVYFSGKVMALFSQRRARKQVSGKVSVHFQEENWFNYKSLWITLILWLTSHLHISQLVIQLFLAKYYHSKK